MNRVLMVLLTFGLWTEAAQAYVDPGSGMLVWQGLLALIGGILMIVRDPLGSLKLWWGKLRRKR
ncbi:MAG: hypothetical protein JNJ71_02620 [Rubrivivax sp.]|nr:hypothetical protein [Rubrivivax sp.]